jgi:hypothetical protein
METATYGPRRRCGRPRCRETPELPPTQTHDRDHHERPIAAAASSLGLSRLLALGLSLLHGSRRRCLLLRDRSLHRPSRLPHAVQRRLHDPGLAFPANIQRGRVHAAERHAPLRTRASVDQLLGRVDPLPGGPAVDPAGRAVAHVRDGRALPGVVHELELDRVGRIIHPRILARALPAPLAGHQLGGVALGHAGQEAQRYEREEPDETKRSSAHGRDDTIPEARAQRAAADGNRYSFAPRSALGASPLGPVATGCDSTISRPARSPSAYASLRRAPLRCTVWILGYRRWK